MRKHKISAGSNGGLRCVGAILILVIGVSLGSHDPVFAASGAPQLTILFSGELNGKIEPLTCPSCGGGLARRHTLVRSVRLEQHPVLLLEGGDLVQGIGAESELLFQTALLAMNEMGYDALNIGELDVALGMRFLTNMARRARFPFISANLADLNGERFFPAYTMVERSVGGTTLRVAVIGVLSRGVRAYLEKESQLDVTVIEPEQAIATTLERLRGKADMRVLLAHAQPEEALPWGRAFPELDVIVYSHEAELPAENESSTARQIVVNAGREGQYIGRLDVQIDSSMRKSSHTFTSLMLSDLIPDSPVVRAILDTSLKMMVERRFRSSRALDKPERGGSYVGSKRCAECHQNQFSIWSKQYHAKAFAPLWNERKETDPECLRCHTTGYRFFTGFTSDKQTPELASVGCEACHGVGSNHLENPTKRYGRTRRSDCKSCHDEENSPRFSYSTYYKKIAHEQPAKKNAEIKREKDNA